MPKLKTRAQFIQDAQLVHGDKYDYSLSEYVNNKTKVKIICPEHGVFEQRPNCHLMGQACSVCSGNKQLNTKEFIQKAKRLHGDKYDYSLCIYVDAHKKVKIICPTHGMFEQKPNSHLMGQGCSVCGGKKQLTTKEFVKKSKQVHGESYDYSVSHYVNSATKVKIICPIHGVFEQVPSSHLSGHGCAACSGKKRLNTKEFVQKAKQVHGEKYNYSKCVYIRALSKVKIICPTHGVFEQKATAHLRGHGCTGCAGIKSPTTEEFIERVNKIHAKKYDYSECTYINDRTKIKIICPTHGAFEQAPNSHLMGQGCPSCAQYGFDPTKPGLLYFLKFEKPFASFWKIGITNKTIKKRFGSDHAFITSKYTWVLDIGRYAHQIEQSVLKEFREYRFDDSFLFSLLSISGDTECFIPSMPHQKVVDFIESKVRSYQTT
jgi:hypothetical protein